ncbi:MAG: twin-arginine translocase subunit TatB [bacterium]|nr:twin-arginine translocase subunit TatB [bacterium]
MFDIGIGFSELMLLAVLVIIVVGPEELPSLLRTIGRYIGQVKRIAGDFRSQVDEAIKEPMEDIQESIEGVTEDLDDDPFGEEDLIDFEEHNQDVLDKEQEDLQKETATERALRESGLEGLDTAPPPDAETKTSSGTQDNDVVLAKKSGT